MWRVRYRIAPLTDGREDDGGDIKKNEKDNYLFFRCAKKNMCSDMVNKLEYCELDVDDEACNYFMKYNMFTYTH